MEGSIPKNTRHKAFWAYGLFRKWANWRLSTNEKHSFYIPILGLYKNKIIQMSSDDLDCVISNFISQVCKEMGERYCGRTLHGIISSLQKYLHLSGKSVKLIDPEHHLKLYHALDMEMTHFTHHGIRVSVKHADTVTSDMEKML